MFVTVSPGRAVLGFQCLLHHCAAAGRKTNSQKNSQSQDKALEAGLGSCDAWDTGREGLAAPGFPLLQYSNAAPEGEFCPLVMPVVTGNISIFL